MQTTRDPSPQQGVGSQCSLGHDPSATRPGGGGRKKLAIIRHVGGTSSPSGARVSQDVGPPILPVGSCGCDHDHRPTASRAWSMAASRRAISGRPIQQDGSWAWSPIGLLDWSHGRPIRRALAAGIEFIEDNGGGEGERFEVPLRRYGRQECHRRPHRSRLRSSQSASAGDQLGHHVAEGGGGGGGGFGGLGGGALARRHAAARPNSAKFWSCRVALTTAS